MDDYKLEVLGKITKAIRDLNDGSENLKDRTSVIELTLRDFEEMEKKFHLGDWDTSWANDEGGETPSEKKKRLAKEKKRRAYQKKYRARKKLEKQCHELMEEVKRLNEEYRNTYNRFDIMDLDDE